MRKAQRGGLYKNIIPLTAAATAVGAPIVADYNNWQPAAGTTGHSLIPESGVDALLGAIPGVALGMLPGPFRRLGRSMPAKYRLPLFGAAGAALGFAGGQKKVYSAPSIAEAGELGLFDAQTPTNPGSQGGKTTINPYTGTAVPTAAGAAGGALGMGRSSTLAPMRQQLNQVDAQIAQLRQQANSLRSQGSARGNLAAYDLSNQLLALEKQRASILQLTSRETERLERIRQERLQRLATLQAENSAWASRHTGRVADTNALIDSATNGGGWGSAFSRALLEWGGRPQLERTLGAQDASETLNNRILQQMNSLSGGPVR
jgi:hypothetical protein